VSGGRAVPLRLHRLRQVHGAEIRIVTDIRPGAGGDESPTDRSPEGDGLVSVSPSVGLAVLTADCASIALGSDEGVFAAVHAGWRGLLGGVVEAAAAAMRGLGATTVHGAVGPTIHAECYQFSEVDLDSVAARYGDRVRSVTSTGHPALDLPATVTAALDRAGVLPVPGIDACTSCDDRYFSHRGRADPDRQALVVWSTAGDQR
jgi:YfiH family protein